MAKCQGEYHAKRSRTSLSSCFKNCVKSHLPKLFLNYRIISCQTIGLA